MSRRWKMAAHLVYSASIGAVVQYTFQNCIALNY